MNQMAYEFATSTISAFSLVYSIDFACKPKVRNRYDFLIALQTVRGNVQLLYGRGGHCKAMFSIHIVECLDRAVYIVICEFQSFF